MARYNDCLTKKLGLLFKYVITDWGVSFSTVDHTRAESYLKKSLCIITHHLRRLHVHSLREWGGGGGGDVEMQKSAFK